LWVVSRAEYPSVAQTSGVSCGLMSVIDGPPRLVIPHMVVNDHLAMTHPPFE
jgi:hypothetical protein